MWVILAGGPSVKELDLSLLAGRQVIAINSAWRTYPAATALFFADDRWWRELGKPALGENADKFSGEVITTSKRRPPRATFRKNVTPRKIGGLSSDKDAVALERSSVSGAINEAVHRGARDIVLLGVDGKVINGERHHHGEVYRWQIIKNSFQEQAKEFEVIAPWLKERGVRVINANPDSAIDVWPKMKFEEAMELMPRAKTVPVVEQEATEEAMKTVRVFVGCSANGEDAESQAVLEHTLRKHSSLPIEITWMMHSRDPQNFWSGFNSKEWKTPFSGFRWAVPAACGYKGRAIYMDSDVIVMADIAELWTQNMNGHAVLAKHGGRLCVSLWDCAAAKKFLLPIDILRSNSQSHKMMQNLTRQNPRNFMGTFEGDWNCLDGEGHQDLHDGIVKAIHYTEMSCQPHLEKAIARLEESGQKHWMEGKRMPHPRKDLQSLFDLLLDEAENEGYVVRNYIPNQLYGQYVKASLVDYKGGRVRVPIKPAGRQPAKLQKSHA